jgi:hypothetical protein
MAGREDVLQCACVIAHNSVHAQVKKPSDFQRIIDGPNMHLQT